MDNKAIGSPSAFLRLFNAQSILGVLGSTVPFDSKYDDFRHCIFDAMMAIVKCSEVLSKLYESENS